SRIRLIGHNTNCERFRSTRMKLTPSRYSRYAAPTTDARRAVHAGRRGSAPSCHACRVPAHARTAIRGLFMQHSWATMTYTRRSPLSWRLSLLAVPRIQPTVYPTGTILSCPAVVCVELVDVV